MNQFRAKRVDNNQWVFGDRVQGASGKMYIFDYDDVLGHSQINEVIPETVGVFTGSPDKNGINIFKGDIVKRRYYPLGANEKAIEYYNKGIIEYNNGSFGVLLKFEGTKILDSSLKSFHHKDEEVIYKHPTLGADYFSTNHSLSSYEVIGNIHESDVSNG